MLGRLAPILALATQWELTSRVTLNVFGVDSNGLDPPVHQGTAELTNRPAIVLRVLRLTLESDYLNHVLKSVRGSFTIFGEVPSPSVANSTF